MAPFRSWADGLPTELLLIIAMKSYPDDVAGYATLRLVCKHWARSLRYRFPVPPFLLVPPTIFPNQSIGRVLPSQFLNMAAPQFTHIPHLDNNQEHHHRVCVGSSHGWMINLDENSNMSLLNPVTGDGIFLEAPLSSLHELITVTGPGKFIVKEKNSSRDQTSLVHIATLSADPAICRDFILILFISDVFDMCFTCRGINNPWVSHQHRAFLGPVEDVISFKGVFAVFERKPILTIFDFRDDRVGLVQRDVKIDDEFPKPTGRVFLVEREGRLLMVYLHPRLMEYRGWFKCQVHFDRFNLDGMDTKYQIESGPHHEMTLFLGQGCSTAVWRHHFSWLTAPIVLHFHMKTPDTTEWWGYIFRNSFNDDSLSTKLLAVDYSPNPIFWTSAKPFWVSPNIRRLNG